MLQFIGQKLGITSLASAGLLGLIGIIVNLIMKKFEIHTKIAQWLDKIEVSIDNYSDKIFTGANKVGFKVGVVITGYDKKPIIGKIYQNAIEPILISILNFVNSVQKLIIEDLTSFISNFINGMIKGLRSDNPKD